MLMYSDWSALLLVVAGIFIWLGILTILIWQNRSKVGKSKKLLDSVFDGEEEVKLDQLVRKVTGLGSQVEDIKGKINNLTEDGMGHIQKVELLRYNPLGDTGGDQSFSIALLNKKGTGFVITSLHSRSGTRVFAKPVIEGKAEKYKFSEEEEKVTKLALSSRT